MALTDNLVSYWKLDESSGNAADSAASGNTLTNTNAVTYTTGKIGNAASFAKASTQYFTIASASQTGLGLTGDMSFSCWIKFASAPGTDTEYCVIAKYASTGNQRGYLFSYLNEGGTLKQRLVLSSNGTAAVDLKVAATISTGFYHHYAVTYLASSGTATFYLDGVSQGTATGGPSSVFSNSARVTVGVNDNGGAPATGGLLNGQLDELGVWNRELSSTEISQLYNSGVGLAYPFTSSGTVLFSDNFDALSTGNINGQGGWSATANGNYTVSTAQAFSTPNSLAGLNNDNGQNPVSHTFTATGGTITLTGYIRTDTVSIVGGYCGIMDGSGNGWFVRFNSAGNFFLTDSTTFTTSTTFGSYTNNTWYKLEMEVDSTNKQARSRVNGGTWSSYVSNASYGGTASLVKLVNGGNYTGTSYWDNILVSVLIPTSVAKPNILTQAVKRASYY